MTTGTIAWLIVGAISAVIFFGIAVVVTIYGLRDLRELTSSSSTVNRP
jgi:hypothetical protein